IFVLREALQRVVLHGAALRRSAGCVALVRLRCGVCRGGDQDRRRDRRGYSAQPVRHHELRRAHDHFFSATVASAGKAVRFITTLPVKRTTSPDFCTSSCSDLIVPCCDSTSTGWLETIPPLAISTIASFNRIS